MGTCLPAGRRSAWPAVVVLAEHALPQVTERTCEQPGYVHLRYAKPFPDLGLGHVAVEAHHQQALLTFREIAPVRPDGLHVQGVLELRIVLAEYVGQVPRVRPAGPWRVQRGGLEGEVGALRVTQLVVADPQVLRQFVVLGGTGELVGQLGAGPAQLKPQLLSGALDVYVPPLVPEVPLDLPGDARLGVGGQVAAEGWVEVVDRLEQADVADLHQFLWRLRAVPVSLCARPDQRLVTSDELFASIAALLTVSRQRLNQLHQFGVAEAGGLADGGLWMRKNGGHWRSPAVFLVCTSRLCPWCGL